MIRSTINIFTNKIYICVYRPPERNIFAESQYKNLPYLSNNFRFKNTIQYDPELSSFPLEDDASVTATIKFKMNDIAKVN